jgi:hypothetical protein
MGQEDKAMMKRVRYPYRGSVSIWRDIDQNHTYVMFFASTKREPNWGVNPDFLLDLWKFGVKKLSIDLVPLRAERTTPDMNNLLNRTEFMKIMNEKGRFDESLGFYKILCANVQINRAAEQELLDL